MNRRSGQWPSQQTMTLGASPTQQEIAQVLKLAERSTGQVFTVNWKKLDRAFFLEVVVVEQARLQLGRERNSMPSGSAKWTYGENFGHEKRPVWTQFTRDLALIEELLADQSYLHEIKNAPRPTEPPPAARNTAKKTGRFNALKLTMNTLPTSQQLERSSDVNLSGELSKVDITGILQSISICKMTGRLDLQDTFEGIEIYFEDGVPVHACQMNVLSTTSERTDTGDTVLLSALIWNSGSFSFIQERKTSERSIRRKLEILLLEGACLRDYNNYLNAANLNGDSIIFRSGGNLSETEFATKLSAGMPMDTKLQKSLYDAFDGKTRLSEIVNHKGLARPVWVPIVFSLLSSNLITTNDVQESAQPSGDELERIPDKSQIIKAEREITRYETGLLSFPLFTLFIERELDRFTDSGVNFALVIFEIWHEGEPLSNDKLQIVASCFRSIAASYDLIGHFRDFEFAMLLPLRAETDTREFVELFKKFVADALGADDTENSIKMQCGLATGESGTSDNSDLNKFITSALKAKQLNKQRDELLTSVNQLRWEELRLLAESETRVDDLGRALALWRQVYEEATVFDFNRQLQSEAAERYASVLLRTGNFSEAENILVKLVNIRTVEFGAGDILTIEAGSELAHCYYAQGKFNDAEWLIESVMNGYIKHFGECCPIVGTCYMNLATLHHVQLNYAAAAPAYRRALEIRTATLGSEHPDTIKCKQSLAGLLKVFQPEPVQAPTIPEPVRSEPAQPQAVPTQPFYAEPGETQPHQAQSAYFQASHIESNSTESSQIESSTNQSMHIQPIMQSGEQQPSEQSPPAVANSPMSYEPDEDGIIW